MASQSLPSRLIRVLWGDWQTNDLWQRCLKLSLACTAGLILAIAPDVVAIYGPNTFLVPMTAVFGNPGQRMGPMIESLAMIIFGSLLGLGWSILGVYLSSLLENTESPAAFTIRALFLLASTLVHGFVRSKSPRLFVFVLFLLIASLLTQLGKSHVVTLQIFTSVMYPVLSGAAISLVVNLVLFPELSSSHLGTTTIDTLHATMESVDKAVYWFITPGGDTEAAHVAHVEAIRTLKRKQKKTARKFKWLRGFLNEFPNPFRSASMSSSHHAPPRDLVTLANLTSQKGHLRTQLSKCKAAQNEVNYEISISSLAPVTMKPISTRHMASLVQSSISLICACENKFLIIRSSEKLEKTLTSDTLSSEKSTAPQTQATSSIDSQLRKDVDQSKDHLNTIKPLREVQSGNAPVLEDLLCRLRPAVATFQTSIEEAKSLLSATLAYCSDVPRLPHGAGVPKGVPLEELDIRIDAFASALAEFDQHTTTLLKSAAAENSDTSSLMPRMEMFLVSSFLLSFRSTAIHLTNMLRHSRTMVEERQRRNDRLRIWLPHITDLRQFLSTGGETDGSVLTQTTSLAMRQGGPTQAGSDVSNGVVLDGSTSDDDPSHPQSVNDEAHREEAMGQPTREKPRGQGRDARSDRRKAQISSDMPLSLALRRRLAVSMEQLQSSDHLSYAVKLAVAVFLTSWPAFVPSWNKWYTEIRGLWAPLQLILVFEVAIGTSLFVFFVRLAGVLFGCILGYLSFEIARGHRAGMIIVLVLGVIPSAYVQLGTKYVKAGMIAIVSLSVVGIASVNRVGRAYELFYKRLIAFLVGGLVALLVEVLIYPVRARDRLVESLSSSVRQISRMMDGVHVGVDDPTKPNFKSKALIRHFARAKEQAEGALAAAETFLPFCLAEPRLKGSFRPLAPIYREIIYVLHQIIDRMDNVIDLRKEHGSSILEDLNADVYLYRRNVSASSMLMLFSVNEALSAWLPLPQFLPSPRLAQLRLINRVREVVASRTSSSQPRSEETTHGRAHVSVLQEHVAGMLTQRKFLSWNASAAGQMEIIEYLEELVELTKLLVGVNAFRSGMLERPRYRQYAQEAVEQDASPGTRRTKTHRSASHATAASTSHAAHHRGSTTARADSLVGTAHSIATGDEGGGDLTGTVSLASAATRLSSISRLRGQLMRSATQRSQPLREEEEARDSDGSDEMNDDDDEGAEGEAVPMSLQRVGMRMQQDNIAVRRKAFSGDDHES